MNKIKIVLEIESSRESERRSSKLEKLIKTFLRFWEIVLSSDLPSRVKTKLLQQIITIGTVLTLSYLLVCLISLILNSP